jgi:hypothetical protein
MRTIDAPRRRPMLAGLSALMGLALVTTPAAADQEQEQAQGQRMEVACSAAFHVSADGDIVYHLPPGGTLECTVVGLLPGIEAHWGAFLYDQEHDSDFDPQGGPLEVSAAGTASFAIEILADPPFIGMYASVRQGRERVEFQGTTRWYWEREMTCTPDPVPEGGTVECVAEDMEPNQGFEWQVSWGVPPGLNGTGTADADGVVVFSFEVPAGEGKVEYRARADQNLHFASYRGAVGPASTVTSPRPEQPTRQPQPTAQPVPQPAPQPAPQPVTVQQPTRVDTGAGGAATTAVPLLLLAGALVVGAVARGAAASAGDPRG